METANLRKTNEVGVAKGTKHSARRVDTPVATPPSTPTPAATQAHDLYAEIRSIYQKLAPCESLAPCEEVNSLLTRLVTLCVQPYGSETVDHFNRIDGVNTLCRDMQALCSTAEGELEQHWASHILNSIKHSPTPAYPAKSLESFPYHKNYVDLSALEASILTPFLSKEKQVRNIAFLGSGPLPLSSFLLTTHFPTATITNIDYSLSAINSSSSLAQKLGLGERMRFVCGDARTLDICTNIITAEGGKGNGMKGEAEAMGWDVVFFAALVGMTGEAKVDILRSLATRLKRETLVVCRSAHGMRRALYPILELGDELLRAGYEILAEMHPWGEVVNSVIVLRVR